MVDEVAFDSAVPTGVVSRNPDAREAKLEAAELNKYLMAKTFFDCREYDRCAAVFLPMTLPKGPLNQRDAAKPDLKGKAPLEEGAATANPVSLQYGFPNLSEKALFLALYAKYMAGEKRRDEETESILGPRDTGAIVNRELVGIGQALEARMELIQSKKVTSQGWLEYLYGVVLARSKNDEKSRQCLLRSVYMYPYNWSAWQELGLLVTNKDEVR